MSDVLELDAGVVNFDSNGRVDMTSYGKNNLMELPDKLKEYYNKLMSGEIKSFEEHKNLYFECFEQELSLEDSKAVRIPGYGTIVFFENGVYDPSIELPDEVVESIRQNATTREEAEEIVAKYKGEEERGFVATYDGKMVQPGEEPRNADNPSRAHAAAMGIGE